jgi:hypothetical protein
MQCKRCGCTDQRACEGGCQWVLPDLCSACLTSDERQLLGAQAVHFDEIDAVANDDRLDGFIRAALTGILANPEPPSLPEGVAERAIEIATAVMKATAPSDLVVP